MHLNTDDNETMDESSTVKLQIPRSQHLRLHCLKIITGETMSDIATEAFEQYFEDEEITEEVVV